MTKFNIEQDGMFWTIQNDGQAVDKWGNPSETPALYWCKSRAQFSCDFLNSQVEQVEHVEQSRKTAQSELVEQTEPSEQTEKADEQSEAIRPEGNKRRDKRVQTDD